ncbi:hypothetical protein ACWDSJ_02530 [Nocardia sp. NPDC003482]|uniref:hypothetical protein n=1 Tax=Nocardia sp. NPDC004068 TaxID=3364303 RepID=UPI0036B4CE73
MSKTDVAARLNLVFEMWERANGTPLADSTVARWVCACGCPVSGEEIARVRRGEQDAVSGELRLVLADVFDVDPDFFAARAVLEDPRDLGVVAEFDNGALRRLGRAASGLSVRTLLYLGSVADALRRAENLPDVASTARI